jgi:PTH1 family peptidyl-tRNA hydrolase
MSGTKLAATEPRYDFSAIRAIIGLGNPGSKYVRNRHNIGFRVVDAIADAAGLSWQTAENMVYTAMPRDGRQPIYLIKPQTYMNTSGQVMPWLTKKGIKPEQVLVVHDELEKKFDQVVLKFGGSHKGHNGLRSIIAAVGADFWRVRVGIDRPSDKDEVPNYVLANFPPAEEAEIPFVTEKAVRLILG